MRHAIVLMITICVITLFMGNSRNIQGEINGDNGGGMEGVYRVKRNIIGEPQDGDVFEPPADSGPI
ncbi:hypothetical protein KP79_PYT19406 [Mizuhopecten yessoensis]|uniref:Uncharacterized protein n=1 Tax=Mizuhopecten yessoensis TaxID=6573 RepID=A0A210PNW3_MIZYE|nr:hypothetical protein KP79_PYT19406 [Mizuhopecten yessoensis]